MKRKERSQFSKDSLTDNPTENSKLVCPLDKQISQKFSTLLEKAPSKRKIKMPKKSLTELQSRNLLFFNDVSPVKTRNSKDVMDRSVTHKNNSQNVDEDSDVDDPTYEKSHPKTDSEVILVGVKRPMYQEIVLDDDDEDEVIITDIKKAVIDVESEEFDVEEITYNCTLCNKVFRVESLLKFHVKMHGIHVSSPRRKQSNKRAV